MTNTLYSRPELYDAEFFSYRADLRFYQHALRSRAGVVVELGCGTGRLFVQLEPVSYIGVNVSATMLARFKSRAPAVVVTRGDLRELPMASNTASLVILAYNVLQHMMDMNALIACLSEARRIVRDDGAIALDTFMPPLPGMSRDDDGFGYVEQRRHPDGRIMEVAEETKHAPESQLQITRLRFAERQTTEAPILTIHRRLWHCEALVFALGEAGLRIAELWGDVDGEAWTPRSPRFMALCVRR